MIPEIIPFKTVSRDENIPQKNPPSKMQPTNIAFTDFEIISALVKIYENINVRITEKIAPQTAESKIPTMFLVVEDISLFFFNTFLRIKNPSHSIKNMRVNFLL